jgi:hypothetical protein
MESFFIHFAENDWSYKLTLYFALTGGLPPSGTNISASESRQ